MSRMEKEVTKKIRSSQEEKVLNKSIQQSTLELMSMRMESWRYRTLPSYVEKTLALNKVICYRCMDEIELGSIFKSGGSGARVRKYYHSDCFNGLYQ